MKFAAGKTAYPQSSRFVLSTVYSFEVSAASKKKRRLPFSPFEAEMMPSADICLITYFCFAIPRLPIIYRRALYHKSRKKSIWSNLITVRAFYLCVIHSVSARQSLNIRQAKVFVVSTGVSEYRILRSVSFPRAYLTNPATTERRRTDL